MASRRKDSMNESVMVLGGAGFLGRFILTRLRDIGVENLGNGDLQPVFLPGVTNDIVDVLKSDLVDAVCRKYDVIINCTGQATNPINVSLQLNSSGLKNIASAVDKWQKKLVQISSVSVYGARENVDETTELNPETPYGVCKAISEILAADICWPKNLLILRLSNLFGQGQSKGVLAYMRRAFHGDKRLDFNNNGNLLRYYLHAEDCAEVIARMIMMKDVTGVFNLIGTDRLYLYQLVQLTEELLQTHFTVTFHSKNEWENIPNISDCKLRSLINLDFRFNLRSFIPKYFSEE